MELLIMIDAAKRASAARITAVIPFLVTRGKTEKINLVFLLHQNWLQIFSCMLVLIEF